MTTLRTLAATLALLLALGACTPDDDGPIVVLVASSLVDVTADLADTWGEGEVLISDAGSQVLDAQLRGGADADVVLLADPDLATALTDDGLADAADIVATNALVIAVAPRAVELVGGLGDLADPAIRLVLADAGVPLGDATRAALELAADQGLIASAEAVLDNAVSFEDAARVVLAKVSTQEVDAAVVYATDALAADARVRTVAWPASAAVSVSYTVQDVRGGRAAGRSFSAFVRSPEAAEVWERHGFGTPTDAP